MMVNVIGSYLFIVLMLFVSVLALINFCNEFKNNDAAAGIIILDVIMFFTGLISLEYFMLPHAEFVLIAVSISLVIVICGFLYDILSHDIHLLGHLLLLLIILILLICINI